MNDELMVHGWTFGKVLKHTKYDVKYTNKDLKHILV